MTTTMYQTFARIGIAVLLTGISLSAAAQQARSVTCDEGVLRWSDNGSAVALFGVNYYAPFALDFQQLQAAGVDQEEALVTDLTHLRRLGLDALRLHCWDREISDHAGNLVDTEHLRLLDRLLAEASRRGIRVVLTPIAWWGTPTPNTPGFSNLYTMHQMTQDPQARECQRRYLAQFVEHRNRYTGLRYLDDPNIVAFEMINEPIYPPDTSDDEVIAYIDALAGAVRDTGCSKPLFFNCWGGREEAASRSTIDGVTFGWYPTGLASGQPITHNVLPLVDRHQTAHTPCLNTMAKIVYEFDAADVPSTFMYPAMAREFRRAGIQIATQFQYDALALAATNVNWQTHFLNLVYTPGKAMSFAIAAEAFRALPRHADFGEYPANMRFGKGRVSFAENLSEWVTDQAFLYTNSTPTMPPSPDTLERIWGVGSSPMVSYQGTGAYFLDRANPGTWRLQVYPDAVTVDNPYRGGSNEKVRLIHTRRLIRLTMNDLGKTFRCVPVAGKTELPIRAENGAVAVLPGEYLLTVQEDLQPTPGPLPFLIPSVVTGVEPAASLNVPEIWREGFPVPAQVTVATAEPVTCALRLMDPTGNERRLPLAATAAYTYEGTIDPGHVEGGRVWVSTEIRVGASEPRLFPGNRPGTPVAPVAPVDVVTLGGTLPNVEAGGILRGTASAAWVTGPAPGKQALRLQAQGFGPAPSCTTVRLPASAPPEAARCNAVKFTLRAGPATSLVELTLVQDNGEAFGANIPLSERWSDVIIPFSRLHGMWGSKGTTVAPERLHQLAMVIGSWILPATRESDHWVEIAGATLLQQPEGTLVTVLDAASPVPLVLPAGRTLQPQGHPATCSPVPGSERNTQALRVAVDGFGPKGDCTSMRLNVFPERRLWLQAIPGDVVVSITARAVKPQTERLELVLLEEDAAPWGTEVELTTEWRTIDIPISGFRYFKHWDNPPGRGGPGDHLRIGEVSAVNLCFGTWLFPKTAPMYHAFEIEEIAVRAIAPSAPK